MKTITFYSYKGGVGRSLALSNIAARLSELKKKVCVIDFDLEAPGLHFKFKNYNNTKNIKAGIVDYIYDFSCENILQKSLKQYTYQLSPANKNYSSIYFIPAGDIDSADYWRKLSKIRWSDLFYEKDSLGLRFFLDLKMKIETEINPDFLLIDSRTGITDISGITLRVLADEAVVLSAYNEESLFGSKRIIKNLYNTEKSLFNNPIKVNFVLSRIPFSNDIKDREKEALVKRKVQQEFEKYLDVKNFQFSIIHSDRSLEEDEKHLIGYEINENRISISNDYLNLFDILTKDVLTNDEIVALAKLKKAETEFKRARKESNIIKKLEYLDRAIAFDETNHEYYYERGRVHFDLKDFTNAIQDFNTAKNINPTESEIYFALSIVYKALDNIEKSLQELELAIQINSKVSRFYIFKSMLLQDLNMYSDALKCLDDAINIDPTDTELLNARADLHRRMGDYEKAYSDIYKAIEIDAENPLYFGTLAEIFGTQNKPNKFYLNLSIALSRGLTARALNTAKDVYVKFKDEERFLKLLEKNGIDIEDVLM